MYHLTAADDNTNMMGRKADNITLLQIAHLFNGFITAAVAPGSCCHIALIGADLLQAPVYKAGTVKLVWTFGSENVRFTHLGTGYLDQIGDG